MATGDSSGGMYTISGLSAATVYTVEVAAVNSVDIGVYSDLLTSLTSGTALSCANIYISGSLSFSSSTSSGVLSLTN